MAGTKTNYLENAIINAVLRNTTYTSPVTVYAAAFTTVPTEAGGGTEVSGASYARQPVTFGAPSNGVSSNSADVLFPVATGSYGTVVGYAIFDASTSGNMLYYDDAPSGGSVAITTNDRLELLAGSLVITET